MEKPRIEVSKESMSALPRLQAALEYAEKGLRVLPLHSLQIGNTCTCGNAKCSSPGKHPLNEHGVKEASCDEKKVRAWWKQWPFANVGIATGDGLVVIDIDPRHGGSLEALEGLVDTSDCPLVETGSGGWHLYFLYDSSIDLRNTTGLLGEGIDTRAYHGYVVAPPSHHQSGSAYRWVRGLDDIYALPDAALEQLLRKGRPERKKQGASEPAKDKEKSKGYIIPEGKRHDWLLDWVFKLRRESSNEELILKLAQGLNQACCVPPLEDHEVRSIVKSTRKESEDEDVDILDQASWGTQIEAEELPEPKWAIPGFLSEGLFLLVGKTKLGKSWLALQLALAVASGTEIIGFPAAIQGKALYLDLEEKKMFVKKRMKMLLGDTPFPAEFAWYGHWPPLQTEGVETLHRWMVRHPDTKLIIIDTLVKAQGAETSAPSGGSIFRADYHMLDGLKALADRHSVAVVVVHHLRKGEASDDPMDDINGTTGLAAATDGSMVLYRRRGSQDAVLHLMNRQIGADFTLSLTMDKESCIWSRRNTPASTQIAPERQDILNVFEQEGEQKVFKPSEIALRLNKERNTVTQLMLSMAKGKQLNNDGKGNYTLPRAQPQQPARIPESEEDEELEA